MKHKFEDADWHFIKGSALLSVGMALAMLLGFAFSLVLAGAFSPKDFGSVQYSITLALLVAAGTHPFGQHVLARYIGRYKNDPKRLTPILTNAWIILASLLGATLLIGLPILWMVSQYPVGVLVIVVGITLFYTYWGLSSGFQASPKLTAVYLSSNVVQILLVLTLISFLEIESPLLALLIYGLSYLLPLALVQHYYPLPIIFDSSQIRRDLLKEIIRFSGPIWASHAAYLLFTSIDILMLERFADLAAVGVYALSRTLAVVFLFVPTGISTLLMPKAASLSGQANRLLLKKTLAITVAINGLGLVAYLTAVPWLIQTIFGAEYAVDLSLSAILAMGMIVIGINNLIAAVLVGSGRPIADTIGRGVAVIVIMLFGWLLIPNYGPLGAAVAMLLGAFGTLSTYGVMALTRADRRLIQREVTNDIELNTGC